MGGYTEPDEIRAEIERRRKRAQDLEMRELVWGFYYYNLSSLPEKLKKDPATVLPELKETLEISGSTFQFRFGESSFRLIYKELSTETDRYGRNRMDDMTTTRANIALDANDKRVFDFKMTRMVTYTPDMPLFSESMGEISAFIEGPWMTEIPEIRDKIRLHEKAVWEQRNAPKEAKKLREDMKKFGL